MENQGFYVSEDEDSPSTTMNRTVSRSYGGRRQGEVVTGENESNSDVILISSDTDSDPDDVPVNTEKDSPDVPSNSAKDVSTDSDSDLPDVFASDKDCRDTSNLPSTSNGKGRGLGYMKGRVEIKQEMPLFEGKGKTIKVKSSVRPIKDNSSDKAQAIKQETEADDDDEDDDNDKKGDRIVRPAVDSESEDHAEEQTEGVGEEVVECDDDYNVEDGTGNPKEQDEPGNIYGDPCDGTGNRMTLGDLWAGMPSDSQVEPKTYDCMDTPWDIEDTSSPSAGPAWESPMHPVSPECATSVTTKELLLPQDPLSNTSDRDDADNGADVQSTSNTDSHYRGTFSPPTEFLLKQALRYTQRMQLKMCKIPLHPDLENMSNELDSDPSPEPVYKRPKKNYMYAALRRKQRRPDHDSCDESSSTDDDEQSSQDVSTKPDTGHGEQSNARLKRKAHRDKRGQEEKSKAAKSSKERSSSSLGSEPEPDHDSAHADLLHEGHSQEQSKEQDRLSHKSPFPRLDEELMDTGSDEEVHKEGRCLVIRKEPVVSESGTDSDETHIDDKDLEELTSQAGNIKKEPHSSNETAVDSDDRDDGDRMLMSTDDVKANEVEKPKRNPVKASSGGTREDVTETVKSSAVSPGSTPTGIVTLTLPLTPVTETVQSSAVSPGATPTGIVSLTLPLTPVRKRSRNQKTELKRAEEDASKEGKSNLKEMNGNNIVVISEDDDINNSSSEKAKKKMSSRINHDESKRIKGSRNSNRKSGYDARDASGSSKSNSFSPVEGSHGDKNVLRSQKKEPKRTVDRSKGGKNDPMRKDEDEEDVVHKDPPRSKKAKGKTNKKGVLSPDEIKTETFYGTSKMTKVSREGRSSPSARAKSWDEVLGNACEEPEDLGTNKSLSATPAGTVTEESDKENAVYPESMPFSPSNDMQEINDSGCLDTQPFSPMYYDDSENLTTNAVDELGTSSTTEELYGETQPFSPVLESHPEHLTSNAVDDLSTAETLVGSDSLSNSTDNEEYSRRKSIAPEVREYFPTDSQISSLGSDEEVCQNITDNADSETPLDHRSSDENASNQQRAPKEDNCPGQNYPLDPQLSSSLDSLDSERPASRQQQKHLEDTSLGQYFPTDSQLSIDLDSEDTKESTSQHRKETVPHGEEAELHVAIPPKAHSSMRFSKDLDETTGKKILPCQRNAWSPAELDPQQRFLLLQEEDAETMSFSQENGRTCTPPSPADTPSTSAAATGKPIANTNIEKLAKTSKSLLRPSRSDNLLQTMKQTDLQKKKVFMKNTIPTQDIPYSPHDPPIPPILQDPSVKPSTALVDSLQDDPQQPASASSSKMDPENAVTATRPILVHGHSSSPTVSSLSQSSSAAYVTASQAPTCSTGLNVMKPPGNGQFLCPSGPSNSFLMASDTGKPLKKRGLSQTSNIPRGNYRTETSEATLINKELKKEDILSCILSWNTDWYEKHKEVHSAEVLQSFLVCRELPKSRNSYPDVRSYQEAFIRFLLVEMWSKVSGSRSAAKDCHGIWRQNSRGKDLSPDLIEVHYEADDHQMESHGISDGDLVLLDMTTVNAAQNQFQFGLVQGNGLSERTICLALHKSIIVPSSTRLKIVTSLKHYLNQITALLSFHSHPLARHIIKPEDSPVFAKETQKVHVTNDELIKSYMDCLKDTGSKSEVIRLMNGPPGTGKTTFLHRLVRWITRIHKDVPKTSKNPHKLLVCAPTNQSLDVLLRKIWDSLLKHKAEGVRDTMKNIVDGVQMVRVGQSDEADCRLTDFFLSTVVTRMREQGSLYDKLSEDELQTKILQRADVVGCTLEDCGMEIVRRSLEGNVFALVVDDASHCMETEIFLALQCKTKRMFMAGDQEQGIVNIHSKESKDLGFGRSMLERIAENFAIQDQRIHRLETQYRMKEDIAKFPSSYIYLHRLKTENRHPPFFLHPYIIFDVADGEESFDGNLVVNNSEVSFIKELLSVIGKLTSLGIITPSAGQKAKLVEKLHRRPIDSLLIGTPSEFCGLEKDVIILCCTSTSSQTVDDKGFLMNKQVLNLALTRAKLSLIIVGNMRSVQKMSSDWENLMKDATGRQLVFRTLQASYSTDAKNCLSKDAKNGHSDKTTSRPNASFNRPEQHPAMYSNKHQRNASEGRPPSEHQHGERQDGPSRQKEDSFRHRHNPGPRDNPAHGRCLDPMEADAVMPSGVNSLPPDLDSARTSPPALLNRGNARMGAGEQAVPPRDIHQNQPFLANQDRFGGAEQNHPLRHRHISGDAAEVDRGKKQVHFGPGTKNDNIAAKLPRLMNSAQGESGSEERPSGASVKSCQPGPSSRGFAQTQSILKKPEQTVAGPNYSGFQEGAVSNQSHHNLRSHKGSSTVPDRPIGNPGSSQRPRRNSQLPDSSLDSDNGKMLHKIATGMRDNERVSMQQKGKNIAGRSIGKRLPQRSGRRDSNEDRDRRERRPSGEEISGRNINRSSGRRDLNEDRDRRERRPSSEGTSNSHPVSNKNGWRQNRNEQHHQEERSNPRPPRQYHQQQQLQPLPERHVQRMATLQQLATNPVQLDRSMLHNRTVHEAFGNRSTALTEPQPNVRRRKRSNSVKDRQRDYAD